MSWELSPPSLVSMTLVGHCDGRYDSVEDAIVRSILIDGS